MTTRELEKEVNELKKKVAELEKNQINIKGYCVSTGLVPPSKPEQPRYFRCISKEHSHLSKENDGYYGEFSLGLIYKEEKEEDEYFIIDDENELCKLEYDCLEDFEEVKKPEKGEQYWYITGGGHLQKDDWDNHYTDNFRFKSGNVYENELQAEKFKELILKREI